MIITFSSHTCPRQEGNTHITHSDLADEVAGHCPADQLPIEKPREAPVWCLASLIWLSSGVHSICDAEKVPPLLISF